MARLVAVQRWPVEKNAAFSTQSTATSRSASASTMVGFLPPISSCTRASRSAPTAAMPRPTPSEPVNEIARTSGCATSGVPTLAPEPVTRLSTPFGMPASSRIFTSSSDVSGACDAGLKTTVLPETSAGAIFHVGMAMGKFQGAISATTPSGWRIVYMNTRGRSEGIVWPGQPRAFAAEVLEDADRAGHLALGLGDRLAFLAAQQVGHLGEPAFEDRRGLAAGSCRVRAPAWTPSRGTPLRGLDRRVDVGCVGVLQQPDDVAGVGGVDVLEGASGARGAPFAVDEVEVGGRGHRRRRHPVILSLLIARPEWLCP